MAEAVDTVMKLALMLLSAGAVYGGIRSDLISTRKEAEAAMRAATRANERLDEHLQFGRRYGDD